jgi:hypothetical protein
MENLVRLATLSKELGLRLKAASLLPAGVLALVVLGLLVSGAPGRSPDLVRLIETAASLTPGEGLVILLGLVVYFVIVSVALEPLQVSLVRILEGYWGAGRLARILSSFASALMARRLDRLTSIVYGEISPDDEASQEFADARLHQFFPEKERLLPTTLGNAIRAVEDRAGRRYGLDTAAVWPLLYPLLPQRFTAVLDGQRDQIDIAARFCVAFIVATGISFAFLITHTPWLLFPAFTMLLAWLSYRAAIIAALSYGVTFESAFALYRFELRKALHLQLPATTTQEKEWNERLSRFLSEWGWGYDELEYSHGELEYSHGSETLFSAVARGTRGALRRIRSR